MQVPTHPQQYESGFEEDEFTEEGEFLCVVCFVSDKVFTSKRGNAWLITKLEAVEGSQQGKRGAFWIAWDNDTGRPQAKGKLGNMGEGRWQRLLDACEIPKNLDNLDVSRLRWTPLIAKVVSKGTESPRVVNVQPCPDKETKERAINYLVENNKV